MKLGFIGLGKMGKPMATNLLKAGYTLRVYNRSKEAVNELVNLGAISASSPAHVGEKAEVVFLCLPAGQDVRMVLSGEGGLLTTMGKGSLIIDHSTISPEESRSIYQVCSAKGIGFVDAPVSGGVTGAEKGTLSIMVGGKREDFEKAKPLLEILGNNIYYLGASGSGNAMKLINNLLVGITNSALAEAFVLAVKSGLNARQVYEILSESTGDSQMLRRNLPNFILKEDFTPAFTLDMLNKDLGLVEDMAFREGMKLRLGSLAYKIGLEAASSGLGSQDMASIIKKVEALYRAETDNRSDNGNG